MRVQGRQLAFAAEVLHFLRVCSQARVAVDTQIINSSLPLSRIDLSQRHWGCQQRTLLHLQTLLPECQQTSTLACGRESLYTIGFESNSQLAAWSSLSERGKASEAIDAVLVLHSLATSFQHSTVCLSRKAAAAAAAAAATTKVGGISSGGQGSSARYGLASLTWHACSWYTHGACLTTDLQQFSRFWDPDRTRLMIYLVYMVEPR